MTFNTTFKSPKQETIKKTEWKEKQLKVVGKENVEMKTFCPEYPAVDQDQRCEQKLEQKPNRVTHKQVARRREGLAASNTRAWWSLWLDVPAVWREVGYGLLAALEVHPAGNDVAVHAGDEDETQGRERVSEVTEEWEWNSIKACEKLGDMCYQVHEKNLEVL